LYSALRPFHALRQAFDDLLGYTCRHLHFGLAPQREQASDRAQHHGDDQRRQPRRHGAIQPQHRGGNQRTKRIETDRTGSPEHPEAGLDALTLHHELGVGELDLLMS